MVPVLSSIFPDECPGTLKYLEIHYACKAHKKKTNLKVPIWLQKQQEKAKQNVIPDVKTTPKNSVVSVTTPVTPVNRRKPILVTEKRVVVEKTTKSWRRKDADQSSSSKRVPITTPKPQIEVRQEMEEEIVSKEEENIQQSQEDSKSEKGKEKVIDMVFQGPNVKMGFWVKSFPLFLSSKIPKKSNMFL